MWLTSYNRILRYISDDSSTPLSSTTYRRRELENWIAAVSATVENYLNRELGIASYTEYFDVKYGKKLYLVERPPITTLTSVYEDPHGEWDGGEGELSDCIISRKGWGTVLPSVLNYEARKALRVIYTGGLAYHAANTTITTTANGGLTAAKFLIGGTSNALGIVVSESTTTLVVETLSGVWVAGETMTEYTNEDGTSATTKSVVVSTIDRQSLSESNPAIVRATEQQIRYMYKHKDDFEAESTSRDGTNRRRQDVRVYSPLTQESMAMLDPYRKPALGVGM